MIQGSANRANSESDGFAVLLSSGEKVLGRKLILAFGLRDSLPAIPGVEERWGKTVLHCPYCHGIEFSDRELGVLYRSPMSLHQAMLIAEWADNTIHERRRSPGSRHGGTTYGSRRADRTRSGARLSGNDGTLSNVVLVSGMTRSIDAMYLSPLSSLASPIAEQVGCTIEDGPLGPLLRTDADKLTNVPGVYAAGDIARAPHSVSWAVADGVTAGTAAHRALVFG